MFDSRSGWGDGQTRKDCDRVTSVMKKIKQEKPISNLRDMFRKIVLMLLLLMFIKRMVMNTMRQHIECL